MLRPSAAARALHQLHQGSRGLIKNSSREENRFSVSDHSSMRRCDAVDDLSLMCSLVLACSVVRLQMLWTPSSRADSLSEVKTFQRATAARTVSVSAARERTKAEVQMLPQCSHVATVPVVTSQESIRHLGHRSELAVACWASSSPCSLTLVCLTRAAVACCRSGSVRIRKGKCSCVSSL